MLGLIIKIKEINHFNKIGKLIWRYFLYNEILYIDSKGNVETLFISKSDLETEKKYNEILNDI